MEHIHGRLKQHMKEKEADCKILIPSNEQQQDEIAFSHEHGKEKDWSS